MWRMERLTRNTVRRGPSFPQRAWPHTTNIFRLRRGRKYGSNHIYETDAGDRGIETVYESMSYSHTLFNPRNPAPVKHGPFIDICIHVLLYAWTPPFP
jgi:hypothetical protein